MIDNLSFLSVDQTHLPFDFPPAFETTMRERLKADFMPFANAHQQAAPVSIRLNPAKATSKPGSPIPWATSGRYLADRPSFITDPLWHSGAYYVQEASSMFLEQAIKTIHQASISRVLDLCAAPGGKSTHLLSLLPGNVVLVANEVIRSRATILSENIQRWGHSNVIVTNSDPSHFSKLEGLFHLIVVDAPCSGEGLFRKDRDAKKEWSTEHVRLCAARQNRILEDVWPALAAGGHLVYCTCTYNADENEKNLASFSKIHAIEFVPISLDANWGVEIVQHDNVLGYRFYPHRVDGEGFFLSVLRKKQGPPPMQVPQVRKRKVPPAAWLAQAERWLRSGTQTSIEMFNDTLFEFPDPDLLAFIANNLRVVTAGTTMATIKRDKLVPETALAFSTSLNPSAFPRIELSLPEAVKYLKKETLSLETQASGFALATYENLGLGWMNILPNRINNLYPSQWRILKS